MTSDQQVRPRRHVPLWLALSSLLVLIALLVLPPLISIARYKNRITQLVSAAVRRPVRLSSVELRILPRPGFILTDLTVDEDPAYGAEPVLHASTVTTAIRLSSLWRGKLQLSRISVDEASLNLVHTPDGRWNVDSVFRTAASLPGPASGQPAPFPYLEATNSRINIKNGTEKLPYSLVGAEAALWQDSGVWRIRLRAQPARTDVVLDLADTGIVRVEATLHPAREFDQMPLHVDLDWSDAQFGQLTRLLLGSDEGWRGDLRGEFHLDGTAASAQVKSRLRAIGVHRAEFAPVSPLDFDANCAFAFNTADRALQNVLCDSPIGGGRVRLTGSIPGSRSGPGQSPRLTLELDRVPVQAGLDVLRTLRNNVAPGLQAAGAVSGKMTYDPAAVLSAAPDKGLRYPGSTPAAFRGRRRRLIGPPRPPPGPLAGSFTMEGLRLTGDTLSTPIQVARLTLDPALAVPGLPPALTTTVPVPAGGATPLTLTARLSLHRFQLGVHGTAALPRLRELIHVAGIPQAETLGQLAGDPASLDLTVEGPWLPLIPTFSANPGAPALLVPASIPADVGSMAGAITFRDANWKPSFLSLPVLLRTATLRFVNGALRWDPVEFSFGPVEGTAVLTLPPACDPAQPCPPHLLLEFESLDSATLQSAILGAREPGTLLSTLIDRLKPNTTPAWPLLEGTLQADSLDLGPFTFNQVSADFSMRTSGAELTSLDAGTLGGKLHATASLTPGDKPTYKLSGSFQKLDPSLVLQLLAMKASGGPINGSGQIELSGYTEKDLTASAKGDLQFDWSRGAIGNLTEDPVPASVARFDRFTGDAIIANGTLTLGKSQLRRGARKSTVEATITFAIPAHVEFGPPQKDR
jgi:hypothetical protein